MSGFSLVELMMVVIIIGILAAIAGPTYSRSRYRAYALEATEVLSKITAAQEGYRSQFNMYADTSNDPSLSGMSNGSSGTLPGSWYPALTTRDADGMYDFYGPNGSFLPPSWNQLGVRPRQRVRYSYQTIAGRPGIVPAVGGPNPTLGYTALPVPQQSAWYYAVAQGDLDRNGTYGRYEVSNLLTSVTVTNELE